MKLTSPPGDYRPAFGRVETPGAGERTPYEGLDLVVAGAREGADSGTVDPRDGEKELGRFVGRIEGEVPISVEGAAVDAGFEGQLRLVSAFDGLGVIVVTDQRIIGTILKGESVLGEANPDSGRMVAFSAPLAEIGQLALAKRKRLFRSPAPGAVAVQGERPLAWLLVFNVVGHEVAGGSGSDADGGDLAAVLVPAICATQLAASDLSGQRRKQLKAIRDGGRDERDDVAVCVFEDSPPAR